MSQPPETDSRQHTQASYYPPKYVKTRMLGDLRSSRRPNYLRR